MKRKSIFIIFTVLIIMVIAIGIYVFLIRIPSPKFKSGSYIENREDFYEKIDIENSADTVIAYLEAIEYSIEDIDKKNQNVTLTVSVPSLSNILKECIDDISNEYSDNDHDNFVLRVKSSVVDTLREGEFTTISETITMPIAYENRKWFIIQNDQFYSFIFKPVMDTIESDKGEE